MKGARCIPVVMACVLAAGRPGWAAKRDFLPRFVDAIATLELESRFRSHRRQTAGEDQTTDRQAEHRQGLGFWSLWYVYHPRFHYFTLEGTLFYREKRRTTDGTPEWIYDGDSDLLYVGYFLPEHPYNLTVTYEQQGGRAGASSSLKDRDRIRRGMVSFRYAPVTWRYELTFRWDTRKGEEQATDANGREYWHVMDKARNREWKTAVRFGSKGFSTAFQYRLKVGDRFTLENGEERRRRFRSREGALSTSIIREKWQFTTQWGMTNYTYRADQNRRMRYFQKLKAELPYHFSSEVKLEKTLKNQVYAFYDANDVLLYLTSTDSDELSLSGILTHQLYDSLHTRLLYGYDHYWSESLVGVSTAAAAGPPVASSRQRRRLELQSDYTKKTPLDGRLQLTLDVRHERTDRSAPAPQPIKEYKKDVRLNEPFLTSTTEVDKESLAIKIASQADENATPDVLLDPSSYVVEEDDAYRLQITIISLPAGVVRRDTYQVELSFRQLPGDYNIGIDAFEYAGRLDLWKDYLSLFFERHRIRQEQLRGVYTLAALSPLVKRTRVGVTVAPSPFRFGAIVRRRSFQTDVQNDWQAFSEVLMLRRVGSLEGMLFGRIGYTLVGQRVIGNVDYGGYELREEEGELNLRWRAEEGLPFVNAVVTYERQRGEENFSKGECRLDGGILFPRWNILAKYAFSGKRESRSGLPPLEVQENVYGGIVSVRPPDQIERGYVTESMVHRLQLRWSWPEYFFSSTLTGQYRWETSSGGTTTAAAANSFVARRYKLDANGTWHFGSAQLTTGVKWEEHRTEGQEEVDEDRFRSWEWYVRLRRRLL